MIVPSTDHHERGTSTSREEVVGTVLRPSGFYTPFPLPGRLIFRLGSAALTVILPWADLQLATSLVVHILNFPDAGETYQAHRPAIIETTRPKEHRRYPLSRAQRITLHVPQGKLRMSLPQYAAFQVVLGASPPTLLRAVTKPGR